MPIEQIIQQSLFPDMPRENPATDKDGNLMPLWELGLSALFQALQENYKNEGIRIPLLSDTNIAIIEGLYTNYIGGKYNTLTQNLPDISGQTVFNTKTYFTNQFVIAVDGANPPLVTLAKWVPLAVLLTNAGNPNGVVAAVLNWQCYDTVGKILYICTASGNAASAVWTAI